VRREPCPGHGGRLGPATISAEIKKRPAANHARRDETWLDYKRKKEVDAIRLRPHPHEFHSITTSSSDCSGEDTKRTYQGLWRMSDVEGRADIALRVTRSVARRRQLHWLRRCDPRYAPDALPRMDCAGRPPAGLGRARSAFAKNHVRQSSLEYPGLRGEGSTPVPLPPPTFLVLRFLHGRDSCKSLNKVRAHSKNGTVLESAGLGVLSPGYGMFLQSFVLRRFSIVWKSEAPEGQLETNLAQGSNPFWMSESNRLSNKSENYLTEFQFRYNNRSGLGISDGERTAKCSQGYPKSGSAG
jgi:hypothetical protein